MQLRLHLSLITMFLVQMASGGAAAPVDYLREVKPILAAHCHRCHGPSQQKGSMRADTATALQRGGEHGPTFAPGNAATSLLLQTLRGAHDSIARMPYKKPPLTESEIATIAEWVDRGALAPPDEAPAQNIHWAFQPPMRPEMPRVRQRRWPRNPIDQFILARLDRDGITPSPEADRVTLLRRVSLDLTGLPPTPAELGAFLAERRPDAYEKAVERLLASPHFGERWGRHWLDVARYADSNGYSIDAPRSIWKYRDWVIGALNRDLPFDQFAIDQLAGDLLPEATVEQKIATGFHRNTQINQEGGIDPEQFRVESVMDRVNTTATAFLGVTFACAQCHDHKFDPFTQREYYEFYAFFNNTVEDGHGKGAPDGMLEVAGESESEETMHREIAEAEEDLNRYLNGVGNELVKWEIALSPEDRSRLKPAVRDALQKRFDQRTSPEKRLVYAAFRPEDPAFKQRHTRLERLERRLGKPVTTLVMVETREPRETTVFTKGDFTRRGARVRPGVPASLPPLKKKSAAEDGLAPALPNRLDLARWIVSPENPLTARVLVNRIWQQYFGRGLVETENDFGTQGIPPSHPEMLDWLACELIQPGRANPPSASRVMPAPWSMKHLHRLIVTSATYRQSSKARPDLAVIDPNNKLLARQSRLRLDAEIVRDVALTASGLLSRAVGGPSVFPPQPEGVMNLGQSRREWKPSKGADRYRRGMYTFFWRATPHPALMVFDGADGFSSCTRRVRSNTPLQALTLLNDEAFHECAKALALRILREPLTDDPARVDFSFRLCLSRNPARPEKERLLELLREELTSFHRSPEEALAMTGSKPRAGANIFQLAAWTSVARVLLNLDETITRE